MAFGDDPSGGGGFSFGGGRFGSNTFSSFGGAASDILGGFANAQGLRLKAQGDRVEAENFDEASALALQNKEFTVQSTAVKQAQTQRDIYMGLGETRSDVAGAGFDMSGSGLDILRMGASQGALTHQIVGQQGLITEAGFQEQSDAYKRMAEAARAAANSEDSSGSFAELSGMITGGIKLGAGLAGML